MSISFPFLCAELTAGPEWLDMAGKAGTYILGLNLKGIDPKYDLPKEEMGISSLFLRLTL